MENSYLTDLLKPLIGLQIPQLYGIYLEDCNDPWKKSKIVRGGIDDSDITEINNIYVVTTLSESDIISDSEQVNNLLLHINYDRMYKEEEFTIFVFKIEENFKNDLLLLRDLRYEELSKEYQELLEKNYKSNLSHIFDMAKSRKKYLELMDRLDNNLMNIEMKSKLENDKYIFETKINDSLKKKIQDFSHIYVCEKYYHRFCEIKNCPDYHPLKHDIIQCKFINIIKTDYKPIILEGNLVKLNKRWYLKL